MITIYEIIESIASLQQKRSLPLFVTMSLQRCCNVCNETCICNACNDFIVCVIIAWWHHFLLSIPYSILLAFNIILGQYFYCEKYFCCCDKQMQVNVGMQIWKILAFN